MKDKVIKEKTNQYFNSWNTNNVEFLKDLFSPNVILIDWDNYAKGFDNVIEINKNIFDSVKKITATVLNIDIIQNKAYCLITICIDDISSNTFDVMDVLTYNDEYKIESIRAFKG